MNKYILLAITALCLQDMQAQTVVHPSIKTKTTFAIVVDQKSYDEAKSEIDAYRTSIEKEGLGTYLLIDDWKSPNLVCLFQTSHIRDESYLRPLYLLCKRPNPSLLPRIF